MAVGMGLCLAISIGLPYGEFIIQGTRLGLSSSTPAAFFLLFLLVVLVQPLLSVVRWSLNRAEPFCFLVWRTPRLEQRAKSAAFSPVLSVL